MPSAASKMPNLTGTILNERFKLIRTLGSGSYGVVYQAVDLQAPADDCDRAIKLVSKGDRKNSTFSALRREMALHKRASEHPNVITLHEAYEDQEYFVFVMDYCRGGDLGKYLTKKGPYEDGEKLRKAFLGLLDAVDSLHKQKIYHRDLKPQNILVSEDGSKLFIADFGLSSEKNIYSGSCGTPAYMPPECLTEDRTTDRRGSRSDAWALGLILLNMLSGSTPWVRATPEHAIYIEFVEDKRFLLECLPISLDANRIIRRMLRANPLIRARLPEVRAWITALDSFFRPASTAEEFYVPWEGEGEGQLGSTMASELDMQNLDWAPNTRERQNSKTSSSRSSSARSTPMVLTPEGSVMIVKGGCEKKDIADRVRNIVSRLRTWTLSK